MDDYLLVEDCDLLNTNEYTIAFSFRADDPTDGTQALIARGEDWSNDKAQWVVELNDHENRDRLQLWYEEANDADHYFAAAPAIEADKWYHAVVSRSATGRVAIYLDGELRHESIDDATPASVATPVLIGARRNAPGRTQDYFGGRIEAIEIYNVALSHEQIVEIVPPPRLEIASPIDGATYTSDQIDLSVSFDRPPTDLSFSLNGEAVIHVRPIGLIGPALATEATNSRLGRNRGPIGVHGSASAGVANTAEPPPARRLKPRPNLRSRRDRGSVFVPQLGGDSTDATFTAYHAVIYDTTASNDLICSLDFSGAKTVSSGTFTIQFDAAGIITLT